MSQKEQLAKLVESWRLDPNGTGISLCEAAFLVGALAMQEKAAQKCRSFYQNRSYDVLDVAREIAELKPEELL